MKSRIMFLIITLLLLSMLTACVQTSLPDDLSGKIDRSRTVEYVVIKKEQKDDILYIFSGKEKESLEEKKDVKPEKQEDVKDELDEIKPEKPVENEKPPEDTTEPKTPESEVREIPTPVTPPADNTNDNDGGDTQNEDTNDYQIGDEPGAAVIPDDGE